MSAMPAGSSLSKQEWIPATYDEVCLSFLRAEWDKFSTVTRHHDRRLIDNPNMADFGENSLRRNILSRSREPLLRWIPPNTQWYRVRFLQDGHLDELRAIAAQD
jgi:hypothetical protein